MILRVPLSSPQDGLIRICNFRDVPIHVRAFAYQVIHNALQCQHNMSEQDCPSSAKIDSTAANAPACEEPTTERFLGGTYPEFKLYADQGYIFVAIDFEKACPRSDDRMRVSKCGICAFDTRDVVDMHPGDRGIRWQHKIKGFHVRNREVLHKPRHSRGQHSGFCEGDNAADAFFFGQSEWVNLSNYGTRIRQVIEDYYKKGLTTEQVAAGERRKLVLTRWDSRLEMQLGRDLDLGIWQALPVH